MMLWTYLACFGRNIPYEGGSEDTITTVECDAASEVGFTISGTVLDLQTQAPAPAGLCVTAIDPTPALTGGEPRALAAGRVCDDGAFVVPGIEDASTIATFIVVDDCEGQPDDFARIATGVVGDDYADLGDGEAVEGATVIAITNDHLATIEADLARVGFDGESLLETGFLAGPALDPSEAPLSGCVVGCNGCSPYYFDNEPSDGLFGADSELNGSTDAAAEGLFLIPAAGVGQYTCDDGGVHEWDSLLVGSFEGYGVFIQLLATR
ncbi:MAG: hypothetical protein ACI8S6_001966 [Myxococcota bacterium]|jgi:hypothetical protein